MLLATALLLLINFIGYRIYGRMPISTHLYGQLTTRTLQALQHAQGNLELIAFFENGHPLAAPVRALLQEYSETSRTLPGLRIRVRIVEPNRDVAVASELAHKYSAERNCLLVISPNHHQIILPEELVNTYSVDSSDVLLTDFAGESAVTAAIWNITRTTRPAIYFLTGNGEHDPADYDRLNGYSSIARHLSRNWYDVRSLNMAQNNPFPDDCAILVIAGPRTVLSSHALERITTYLSTGGRLLLLMDNVADAGLRDLLSDWGVGLVSTSGARDNGGSGIRVGQPVGRHPITRGLPRVEISFESPGRFSIAPEELQPDTVDKPRARILLSDPAPLRGLPVGEKDDAALVALAVAVERGAGAAGERSFLARMVVAGDAQFASNAMIDGGLDANRDFFLSSIHWLSEQEELIGRTPVTYRILRSGISAKAWPRVIVLVSVLWPLALFALGMLLTYGRRAACKRL